MEDFHRRLPHAGPSGDQRRPPRAPQGRYYKKNRRHFCNGKRFNDVIHTFKHAAQGVMLQCYVTAAALVASVIFLFSIMEGFRRVRYCGPNTVRYLSQWRNSNFECNILPILYPRGLVVEYDRAASSSPLFLLFSYSGISSQTD